MNALFVRIATKTATGYPLALYKGEEADVIARATNDATPDATSSIPLELCDTSKAGSVCYIDLRKSAREVLISADGTDHSLRDLGIQLFSVVNIGDVGKEWSAARAVAKQNRQQGRQQLRTYIEIVDEELSRLPWELMMDGVNGPVIALDEPWSPIVRYQKGAPIALVNDAELRALLVIGCAPDDPIEWVAELKSFLATVCPRRNTVDFEIFEASTHSKAGDLKTSLLDTIKNFRPHVLHFVGHGTVEKGDGALALWDSANGCMVPWTTQEFKAWLEDTTPRLVLLNACRSAEQAANPDAAVKVLASMSGAAVAAGVAAVVAMQHDIAGEAAALFARGFYDDIANQRSVDSALMTGRRAIATKLTYDNHNWALPVCTTSESLEKLLPPFGRKLAGAGSDVSAEPEFESLATFVDRRLQRRTIISDDPTGTRRLAFVVSEPAMGKSSFAKVICEWRLLQGHRVVYADFASGKQEPLNVIQLLRHVRGTRDAADKTLRPNIYASFKDFNDSLNVLLDGQSASSAPSTGVDKELPLDRNKITSQQAWDQIFGAFIAGLQSASSTCPLTIVMDHLRSPGKGVVPDDFSEHVVPRLIKVVNDGILLPKVFIIIVASDQELGECGLVQQSNHSTMVRLEQFRFDDWNLMAREFATRKNWDDGVAEEAIKSVLPYLSEQPFGPDAFKSVQQLAEMKLRKLKTR